LIITREEVKSESTNDSERLVDTVIDFSCSEYKRQKSTRMQVPSSTENPAEEVFLIGNYRLEHFIRKNAGEQQVILKSVIQVQLVVCSLLARFALLTLQISRPKKWSEAALFGVVWNCLDRFLFDFHLNLLWLCLL
jgi:hypothetical protein